MSADTHEHHSSAGFYYVILAALLILTGVTVGVAFVDFGNVGNTILAMAIATVKASLVIYFFMHMKGGERTNWVAIGTGLFLLALLIGFIITEVYTRGWIGY